MKRDRTIIVQPVCPMLPEDGSLDTGWVRGVGGVSILCFFKEAGVGAEGKGLAYAM